MKARGLGSSKSADRSGRGFGHPVGRWRKMWEGMVPRNTWVIALLSWRHNSECCVFPCTFPGQGFWVERAWERFVFESQLFHLQASCSWASDFAYLSQSFSRWMWEYLPKCGVKSQWNKNNAQHIAGANEQGFPLPSLCRTQISLLAGPEVAPTGHSRRWDLGGRRSPFEPVCQTIKWYRMGRLEGFQRPAVTLGGHFNAFFHSGIFIYSDSYQAQAASYCSPPPSTDLPACQHFIHTRQTPPSAFCLNKAQGLPSASRRGSRLQRRPLGEAGARQEPVSPPPPGPPESGNRPRPALPQVPGVGAKKGVEGGNPDLNCQCPHPLAPSFIDHPALGSPIIPNSPSSPARSILPIL